MGKSANCAHAPSGPWNRHHLAGLAALAIAVCVATAPSLAPARKTADEDLEKKPSKAELVAREKERKARERRRAKREEDERREATKLPKNGKVLREDANPLLLNAAKGRGKTTAKTFAPFRTTPRFTGAFQVDVVVISFPDCEPPPSAATIVNDISTVGEHTLKDYYVEYSQGTTWPELFAYDAVYNAPHPLGYYCRYNPFDNRIGFSDPSVGSMRAGELKRAAMEFARKSPSARGRSAAPVTACVYCNKVDAERASANLEVRDEYPKPAESWEFDEITYYKPQIPWADPLWPNSSIQVLYPCDGGVMVHELGHTLGSPDYYHSSEEHDGVPGDPVKYAYGPTGPGYNRYIYHAFAPKECFPTFETNGTFALDARSSPIPRQKDGPMPALGCFIPSAHPNYMFYLEYAHNDKPPVGDVEEGGLLVNVINVTSIQHMLGPPDLCYTYRRGDPFLRGQVDSDVFLREGDTFDLRSDPAAVLPPRIPAGIRISGIRLEGERCLFDLQFTKTRQDAKFLKGALLPHIKITEVDEVLPTSLRAHCDIMYRGEPLLDEYGFVWDVKPNPSIARNKYPLYHRDRYDARILGLKPGTRYFVRAYAKNANGVTYSRKTLEVATPNATSHVPPLLTDNFAGNFYITRHHFVVSTEDLYLDSANPIIALMSLGSYYGTVPGVPRKGEEAISIRDVHTNPSGSRPRFRMKSHDRYYEAMKRLAHESGLREKKFLKFHEWRKRCATALKIKLPAEAFVRTATASALEDQRPKVRKWLDKSQPVLLIRENRLMPDVTDKIFPLDIAIIDGYTEDGTWHVYFPLGCDRGVENTPSGYHSADTLLVSAEDAYLLYWSPLSR